MSKELEQLKERFKVAVAEKERLARQIGALLDGYAPLVRRHIALEDLLVGILNEVLVEDLTADILNAADVLGFQANLEYGQVVWKKKEVTK